MKLTTITQLVVLGAGAVIALNAVTACGKSNESTTSSVVAMPQTATFIGKMATKKAGHRPWSP